MDAYQSVLIILLGSPKAGKNELAKYLEAEHNYTRVHIQTPSTQNTANGLTSALAATSLDYSDGRPRSSAGSPLLFPSSSAFLDHATTNFQSNFVTTDLRNFAKLEEFAKRPFVAIVAIEAPVGVRYRRAVESSSSAGQTPPTLEDFVANDDVAIFGASAPAAPAAALLPPTTPKKKTLSPDTQEPASPIPSPARLSPASSFIGKVDSPSSSPVPSPPVILPTSAPSPLVHLLPLAHQTLSNPYSTLPPLVASLSLPVLADALRPPWDAYFMRLATLASLRSNCMKRRVGAVLVREKRVVSTGYNGTPRGVTNCNEGGCGRCNGGSSIGTALDECLCLHAEENALLEAGRERVSGGGATGAVLYCNTCPCLRCTVKIVQCGVTEVVYSLSYAMDESSKRILREAGVELRQLELPAL